MVLIIINQTMAPNRYHKLIQYLMCFVDNLPVHEEDSMLVLIINRLLYAERKCPHDNFNMSRDLNKKTIYLLMV